MTTKRNQYVSPSVTGRQRTSTFAAWTAYSYPGKTSVETEETISHGLLDGGRWSGGGPWFLSRDTYSFVPETVAAKSFTQGGSPLVEGTARLSEPTTSFNLAQWFPALSNLQLDAMGTTAIARTEPTNPAFDLSVFIGELRAEGLPNLPGTAVMERTKAAKAAGGEYLNVEFGWLPLVRGIRDFAKTVEQSDSILRKYQEGSGKVIQRSYEWPVEKDSMAVACSYSMYPAAGFFTGGGCSSTSFRKTWFECEYEYYVPAGGSINDKFRRYGSYARKLLGIDLSPEVLWNLSPWSWAADWFANTGDVMHNISAIGTDGLVLRNGYMMSHGNRTTVYSGSHAGQYQKRVRIEEHKTRRPATPYGFGVAFSSLSATQVAVISALGLSRW